MTSCLCKHTSLFMRPLVVSAINFTDWCNQGVNQLVCRTEIIVEKWVFKWCLHYSDALTCPSLEGSFSGLHSIICQACTRPCSICLCCVESHVCLHLSTHYHLKVNAAVPGMCVICLERAASAHFTSGDWVEGWVLSFPFIFPNPTWNA